MIAGAAVSWKSRLQRLVALSSCEAEYCALTDAAKECVFLTTALTSVGLGHPPPVVIYEDNQSAIHLTQTEGVSERTKHFNIRVHFIRYEVRGGSIELKYCPSELQIADILTKPLGPKLFTIARNRIMGEPHADAHEVDGEPDA